MQVRRLVNYPCSVRIRCTVCQRAGAYRLARLAARFGSETLLDDRIVRLPAGCAWRDDPPGRGCGARFEDLPLRRPPNAPTGLRKLRVVGSGRS